jgi:hypothetical protein
MSIYKKLQEARIQLQNTKLKKSGHNKFAGYYYFELGDFLPEIQNICNKMGLCGVISFNQDMAYLQITDIDDGASIMFTSPMSSAALKGCHDVQNLGAVQTYLRRYLWVNAFEIVEHDALEPTVGSTEAPVAKKIDPPKPTPSKPAPTPTMTAGKSGEWQLTVMETADTDAWMESLKAGVNALLQLATTPDDVANIFKNNRVVFDKAKELDEKGYAQIMVSFSATKKSLTKE